MIDELTICNLTTMRECTLKLSPKLNVIVGPNGTGKTHILKAAYAAAFAKTLLVNAKPDVEDEVRKEISHKLIRVYKPLNHKLGNLHRHGADEDAEINTLFSDGESLELSFSSRSTYAVVHRERPIQNKLGKPVFLPTKEVLSFIEGINAQHLEKDSLDLFFDATYLDLIDMLRVVEAEDVVQSLSRDPRLGNVIPILTEAMGGRFALKDGRMRFFSGNFVHRRVPGQNNLGDSHEVVFKTTKDQAISNQMTAEGFRKIGVLQVLLANRSLIPGVSGPLFWDEPECNVNPSIVRRIVSILIALTRVNQQVVITTHDYFFLKWIDLLLEKSEGDHVRFHSLCLNDDAKGANVMSTDDFRQITPNPIAETFDELSKAQLEKRIKEVRK